MSFNEKQLQILDTAEDLFATKGFEGTSVRDISDTAGVNVAMISYYFGSKEKLMEALFELRTGHIRLKVEDLLKDSSLTPYQKLGRLIDEHIERAIDKRKFYRIMINEQLTNHNPAIIGRLNELKKRNIEVITELIKEGQQKNVFKKKVDVVLMLNTLVGTVSQTMCSQEFYRDINHQKELPDELFIKQLRRRLSIHIQTLVKAILNYEV